MVFDIMMQRFESFYPKYVCFYLHFLLTYINYYITFYFFYMRKCSWRLYNRFRFQKHNALSVQSFKQLHLNVESITHSNFFFISPYRNPIFSIQSLHFLYLFFFFKHLRFFSFFFYFASLLFFYKFI